MHADKRRWVWLAGALGIVVALWLAPAALAQQPPPISREEFDDHLQRLKLDDVSRRAIVQAIYDDLVVGHRDAEVGLLAFHEWYHDLYAGGLPDLGEYEAVFWGDINRSRRMRNDEGKRLESRYFDSLREEFPEKQETVAWLDRAHLRWRFLNRGDTRHGDAPDLIALVETTLDSSDPYQRAELAAVLERFDREMDAILQPASEMYRAGFNEVADELVDAGDFENLADFYEQFWRPQLEQWLLAKRYLPLIRGRLDPEEAAKFEERANRILYMEIYEPTRIDILLESAKGRDDLTEAQQAALARLERELEAKRAKSRSDMIELTDELHTFESARRTAEHHAARRLNSDLPSRPVQDAEYRSALRSYREIGSELEKEIERIMAQGDGT